LNSSVLRNIFINGFRVTTSNRELERFTLDIASKDVELNEITGWFKEHTKKVQT